MFGLVPSSETIVPELEKLRQEGKTPADAIYDMWQKSSMAKSVLRKNVDTIKWLLENKDWVIEHFEETLNYALMLAEQY